MLIEDGELISGIVCKKTVGASTGSLMHMVFMENGFQVFKENLFDIHCRNPLKSLIFNKLDWSGNSDIIQKL